MIFRHNIFAPGDPALPKDVYLRNESELYDIPYVKARKAFPGFSHIEINPVPNHDLIIACYDNGERWVIGYLHRLKENTKMNLDLCREALNELQFERKSINPNNFEGIHRNSTLQRLFRSKVNRIIKAIKARNEGFYG